VQAIASHRREQRAKGAEERSSLTSDKESHCDKMDLGRVGAGGCRPVKAAGLRKSGPRPNLLGNAHAGDREESATETYRQWSGQPKAERLQVSAGVR